MPLFRVVFEAISSGELEVQANSKEDVEDYFYSLEEIYLSDKCDDDRIYSIVMIDEN